MATITACTSTSSITPTALLPKGSLVRPTVVGLPAMAARVGKVRCSMEGKPAVEESGSNLGMGASLIAAACAATISNPAMALVDDRMTTEGTGLPFGLSNNFLVWIILGVFGLIWSLYIIYTSTLEEDEESGLSL
ncbi:unnamed protein product [Ilex paraguariensis]|uniref:PSII 6.1 kDa protein n=1 Tax=Ilex paraguariensis TaxID=185542 RepID=A0ABC8S4D4_9AQUA